MIIGPPSSTARLITRKTGNSTPLKNINLAARRIPFRRGESAAIFTSFTGVTGTALPESHSANPLNARPQREQNFISENCC
jgi:hypothetical protein